MMKQKRAFRKNRTLLFFTLSLAVLFIVSIMGGKNGPPVRGLRISLDTGTAQASQLSFLAEGASSADPASMLARSGVKECVPRPSVEPPPLSNEGAVQRQSVAILVRQLCPEGFVPQPVERRDPLSRSKFELPFSQQSAGIAMAPSAPTAVADYFYAGGYQYVAGPGSYAFLTQHLPVVAASDFHSLAEIAVQSTDRLQIVEVGWTVDPGVNGDANPHLFVYHWVNGAGTCYNGCGWVQFSPTLFPGMQVAADGTGYEYAIFYWQGNWWIGYQGEWIGYFPGSLWNGSYNTSGLIQWFGELAVSQGTTTLLSTMGNGTLGTSGDPNTAQIYQIALLNDDGSVRGPAAPSFLTTNAFWYNVAVGGYPNWFWYGGKGSAQ
jgi:hypothetical protein